MNRRFPPFLLWLFVGLMLLIAALSIGAALRLSSEHAYTVYDGDTPIIVSGRFATVADLIEHTSISLRPEDIVDPALQQAADPETPVRIQRARPVQVESETGTDTVWTQQSELGQFLSEAGLQVPPGQQLLIEQTPVPPQNLDEHNVPTAIAILPRQIEVSLIEAGQQQLRRTRAATVAELLQELGITLSEADSVDPAPAAPLQDGSVVTITHALPLTIQADGQTMQLKSRHNHPLEVLAEAGITLGEEDYTIPAADAQLQAGDTIEVVRVTADTRYEDEEIPFQTVYQPSDELELDTKAVLSNGVPGLKRRSFRIIYEDGVQVGEALEEEWIETEPVNQVIGYGTKINIATVDTPDGPREYWRVVRMRATAYTAASSGKSPDHPSYGVTASGQPAGTGIVAIDPNVVPFRSEVFVPGYGIGFAGDTGGGIKGRWIDLGYDEDELVAWNRYVDVYYLTPVPENINYLLPEILP